MMGRKRAISIAAILLLGVATASAKADVASQMATELQTAGLPGASVTVVTPSAATASDRDAFEADAEAFGPSLSNDNLISPDPTAPLPLARVLYGAGTATTYPGFVSPPGGTRWPSLEDAQDPVWRLDIMAALKHALAGGASLAGVSMDGSFPNRSTSGPDLWAAPPDSTDLPFSALSRTLPADTIGSQIQASLPVWAQTAHVAVSDAAANERRVTVTLSMPLLQLATGDFGNLVADLLDQQRSLDDQGAAVGSVVVLVNDQVTQLPLMTFAGDATWGQHFIWAAPPALAYLDSASSGLTANPASDAQQVVDGAQQSPDLSQLPSGP